MSKEVEASFKDFVAKGRVANTHPAKLLSLSLMLKEIFGVNLLDLIPGVEKKLGSKVLGLRGSVDLLFSNIVFELKIDLRREEADAKEELVKYFQALNEKYPESKFLGIVTDCSVFKAFSPVFEKGVVTGVDQISSLDTSKATPSESILWLDSFIFSKKLLAPSAEDLRVRFGPESPSYNIAQASLKAEWAELESEKDASLKLKLWARNMEIVYGNRPEVDSFIAQTYLVTIVKLIVFLHLSGEASASQERIREVLSGDYFESYGITNLIEEDYFTWILSPKVAKGTLELANRLTKELLRYDYSQINEDFFKEIYEEVVETGERHRLGEYYTPEWLSTLTLLEGAKEWGGKGRLPRILDPFCGSGTFLSASIRWMRGRLDKDGATPAEALDAILNNIVGLDINPLAGVIARANYLIALGDLSKLGKEIAIPVYVSDSVRIPKVETIWEYEANERVEVYDIAVERMHLQIPSRVAKERTVFAHVLDSLRTNLTAYKSRTNREEISNSFERDVKGLLQAGELGVFKTTLSSLLDFVDKRQDSVWIYIINNIYAPVSLTSTKFDLLVSNPPWISMRYVENKEYADYLKGAVLDYGLLDSGQVNLITQMEVATLCYRRAVDLYLADKGAIAFVMPRSVLTGAAQHTRFREMKSPSIKLVRILDLEDVAPLFNVPCCVLISEKPGKTTYPVSLTLYTGKLEKKNPRYEEAASLLSTTDSSYEAPRISGEPSPYYMFLKAGAAIYPRPLLFVDFDVHPKLGIDATKPRIKTAADAVEDAKPPWDEVRISGRIDARFVCATILGGDIVAFGHVRLHPVALPIEPLSESFRFMGDDELRRKGYTSAADWFGEVQRAWRTSSTEKSKKSFGDFRNAVDYQGLLSSQNPSKRWILLYPASGTNLVACVVDRNHIPSFRAGNVAFNPTGFVADKKTWFLESDGQERLHYLCAILNSSIVNQAIKPMQTRGSFGARDIHRRPFMLPIPRYNEKISSNKRLMELSIQCHQIVKRLSLSSTSAARAREEARSAVEPQIGQIDRIVSKILEI